MAGEGWNLNPSSYAPKTGLEVKQDGTAFDVPAWRGNLLENKEFLYKVANGEIQGFSTIHKFGYISGLGSILTPISNGGFYRTPQTNSPATLEAVSTSSDDSSAGIGAREVTIQYLDSSGAERIGTMTMAGASASTTVSGVLRVNRAFVSSSGTYATQSTSSQKGEITIQEEGGGDVWVLIPEIVSGFGGGQSLIGCYTVPIGSTAFMLSQIFSVDSNKAADLYFFQRKDVLKTSPPYEVMRVQNIYTGAKGVVEIVHRSQESYQGGTDVGFLGKVGTGTAAVGVEFEMLIVDNNFL